MSVLLITGASSDIGIELIHRFADKYDTVWAQYRAMNSVFEEEIHKHTNICLVNADFLDNSQIHSMIEIIESSKIVPDTVIHLPAQKYQLLNFNNENVDNFENSYKVSVLSIVEILKKFIPYMVKNNTGRIVFMLSSCVIGNPPMYTSSYTTVKYALLGLMKELSTEYIKNSIFVNGISPDMIETKFLSDISRLIVQKNARDMPKGRNLVVNDIMPAFKYLLFDGRITGHNIHVQAI